MPLTGANTVERSKIELRLLPGRYVNAGASVFALIDSDTFRVEGYFEETKFAALISARARASS